MLNIVKKSSCMMQLMGDIYNKLVRARERPRAFSEYFTF
jgi:hypothetical protein